MSQVTRFAGRDAGPAARMAGFIGHLRSGGLRLGVEETKIALKALTYIEAQNPHNVRGALRAVCTGAKDEAARFDDLFDAYWLNGGRVVEKTMPKEMQGADSVRSSRGPQRQETMETGGAPYTADADVGEGDDNVRKEGTGKLIASEVQAQMHRDLRELVTAEDIAEAEHIAKKLGAALRDRRTRRRKAARRGRDIHFRRTIRKSLSTGGEPLCLPRKQRPDRPTKIVTICDVSGSMTVYAKVFLAFIAALMRADDTTDAYLFHTRLVRITEALREKDALRAVGRLSLLADGFGGGSKISAALHQFTCSYARRFVNGRSVVLIFSDGYDTAPAENIGTTLASLRKRGCKIIWLNPLKGWDGYEPVAKSMAAALPHIDLFRSANKLADLAALEPELMRL